MILIDISNNLEKRIKLKKDYSISSLSSFKNEDLEGSKNAKYSDLGDIVYRFQLTYEEVIDILHVRYIPSERTGFTLPR